MKKIVLLLVGLLFLVNWANAQVIYNFETDAQGFLNYGWAPGIDGVQRVADPTGMSSGVIQVGFNGTKGATCAVGMESGTPDKTTAQLLTYHIWLPAGTPDYLEFQLFAQDNSHWNHQTVPIVYAKDIPKETWFPLSFPLKEKEIANSAVFDVVNNKFGWCGMQIGSSTSDAEVLAWVGNILIDDVTLNGVQPSNYADFNATNNEFKSLWGTLAGINQAPNPTDASSGALKIDIAASGGAVGIEAPVDAKDFNQLVHWIYLPTGVPDGMLFKVFAQDNVNWAWNEQDYHASDIPKDKWYPIYFDMEAIRTKSIAAAANVFDHVANKIGKLGIEVAEVGDYNGSIYLDDAGLVGKQVGDKWVFCNFESPLAGTQGFYVPNYAATMANIVSRVVVGGNGILQSDVDYARGTKSAIAKDDISIYNNETASMIEKITIDVLLPADCPENGTIDMVFQPSSDYAWLNKTYNLGGAGSVPKGQWVTLEWPIAEFADRITNPQAKGTFAVEVVYSALPTWNGIIQFDNMTLWGIKAPEGVLKSPNVTVEVDTNAVVGFSFQTVHLIWEDNTLGTETYNVYASESAISDVHAAGVIKIATGIAHGTQEWCHRPYTRDGAAKTYYYAVTAFDGSNETAVTSESKVGPYTINTSVTGKIPYVADFSSKFILDGADDEFVPYRDYQIVPENSSITGWDLNNTDLNFKTTMVIDDKFLYISADVVDDDLRRDADQQAWQGDALEFFIGFYDAAKLAALHPKNLARSLGDIRIGFNVLGNTCLDGGPATTVAGVQSTVFEKITGDGYIIESILEIDSLEGTNNFTPTDGAMMPLKLDCNDWDPSFGDTARNGQVQWGVMGHINDQNNIQTWLRPSAWGYMEVLGGPSGVADNSNLPKAFRLYENYPNPFNPTTMIKYDLPKEANVTLIIYDMLGREVATLVKTTERAGYHQVGFNATGLSSGSYIYRLTAGDFVQTKKMMLIK